MPQEQRERPGKNRVCAFPESWALSYARHLAFIGAANDSRGSLYGVIVLESTSSNASPAPIFLVIYRNLRAWLQVRKSSPIPPVSQSALHHAVRVKQDILFGLPGRRIPRNSRCGHEIRQFSRELKGRRQTLATMLCRYSSSYTFRSRVFKMERDLGRHLRHSSQFRESRNCTARPPKELAETMTCATVSHTHRSARRYRQ